MSARCQIGFYWDNETPLGSPDALIYRDWDGYPDTVHGVLKTTMPHVRSFTQRRGFWDAEYCAAYVIAQMKTDLTNYGVSTRLHSDIEYYYAWYPNRLEVYTVEQEDYTQPVVFTDLKHLNTIPYRFKVSTY